MGDFSQSVSLYKSVIKSHLAQRSAKGRTTNPNNHKFNDYMGRGIRMCHGFRDPWIFLSIMGPCDPDKSLDRVNNDGHYSCGECEECKANAWPLNCKWSTGREQSLNRRKRSMLTFCGVSMHASQWQNVSGISAKRIHRRKQSGWSDERILSEPVRSHPVTAKLTAASVLAIRHAYNSVNGRRGIITQLAREHGVLRETIRDVVTGRMWKNLD